MAVLLNFIGLVATVLLINTAMAANMIVGGSNGGWDLSTDLQSWASSQSFTPGDTLTFSFGSFHSVVEVSKADYDACGMNTPIQAYTGGSAVIKLISTGKRYFICGTPGHCSQGMKMEIDIVLTSKVINPPAASPVIPTPNISSPPPVIPAHAPKMPLEEPIAPPAGEPTSGSSEAPIAPLAGEPTSGSAALPPVSETSPPVLSSPEATGPAPQGAQEKNNGGRKVEAGIVLVVSLLMAMAS